MKCNETLTQETMQKYALNIQFDEDYFYKERFLFNIHALTFKQNSSNLKIRTSIYLFLTVYELKFLELIQLDAEKVKKKSSLKSKCF